MLKLTLAIAALTLSAAGPVNADPLVWFGLSADGHPSLRYYVEDLEVRLSCQQTSFVIEIEDLDSPDMSAWFASDEVRITVDDAEAHFYLEEIYPTWWGWGMRIRYSAWRSSTDWLRRIATAHEVRLTTPLFELPLVYGTEYQRIFAELANLCEDERFGRVAVMWDRHSVQFEARPEMSERAVLYETLLRLNIRLQRDVFPATVVWGLEPGANAPILSSSATVPERGLQAEVRIERRDSAEGLVFDLLAAFEVEEDFFGGAITELRDVRISPNEIGRTASAVRIGGHSTYGGIRWEQLGPALWRLEFTESEMQRLLESEVIELSLGYQNYHETVDLILEVGESGRAVFAEAMAAWGLLPE